MTEDVDSWKVIEGYSKYKISEDGKVWSTITNKLMGQPLTGIPQYRYVNMTGDDGKRKLVRVHRLVAEAYVGGRSEEFNVVDHIDRNKLNNHFSNLRWTDHVGNSSNRDYKVLLFGIPAIHYVRRYINPEAAYTYITSYLRRGMTEQQAVDRYDKYFSYGMRDVTVEWENETVYLADLCEEFNKDYIDVNDRLKKDWSIWNALYNVCPEYPFSLEVPCELVTGHWFPTKKYLGEYYQNQGDNIFELLANGGTHQELKSYDRFDHLRQTVLGVTGTIKELCKHFGVSEGCVGTRVTRKGWTLERALTTPQERIRRWSIDGETKSIKEWCEHYELDPKIVNGWKSRLSDRTFKDALLHYGVDCKDKEFLPGD